MPQSLAEKLKEKILEAFFLELEQELTTITEAAFAARDAAISEEARAENKYDTRGLEASYLAGAQAKRASELRETISKLRQNKIRLYHEEEPIQGLALVSVESENGETKKFFIVPAEGGAKVQVDGQTVFLVTPESPIGKTLWNLKLGDEFEFTLKGSKQFYEITSVL
ncbi:MAG: GreA/GreB family elongation factor [Pseudomonadota bacterium]